MTTRDLARTKNRWEHFRSTAVLQLRILERDNVLPEKVTADLRAAIYEADEILNSTVFSSVAADG